MQLTKKQLQDAVHNNILSNQQAEDLYAYLASLPETSPTFSFTHLLYYLGGLIAIGAMTLFMNLGWETFGGFGIFFIALGYAGIGLKFTHYFKNRGYPIPAGICATFVVALTPLAIYGLQQGFGWWPDDSVYRDYHHYIKWHWLYLELGTLLVGLIIAWRYRYPFLMMPIAVTLWYFSMDLAAMLMESRGYDFTFRAQVSLIFGLLMLLLAFWVDFRSLHKADYAFWLYLFAVITFWGGLTAQDSDNEWTKFLYCCINVLMIMVGVIIARKVFVVFGAIGVCLYLGHLSWDVFKDSVLFPIVLTLIGLGIVYLGIVWQKNETVISRKVRTFLPAKIEEFLNEKSALR